MAIKWRDSRGQSIRLGQSSVSNEREIKRRGWQILWQKIMKEKKKFLSCSVVELNSSSYNPNAYQMNFDQGIGCFEPDNLCRSFSARFADPSIVSRNLRLLD